MSTSTRSLVHVAFAVCCIAWHESTDSDAAAAQSQKTVMVTRIYTGTDGLAHAKDIQLALNSRGASEMLKATGAEFSLRPPTPGASPRNTAAAAAKDPGWHTGPARQFVITLSGNSEVEVAGGVHVACGARPYQPDRGHHGEGALLGALLAGASLPEPPRDNKRTLCQAVPR